jgi:hypothetical protein
LVNVAPAVLSPDPVPSANETLCDVAPSLHVQVTVVLTGTVMLDDVKILLFTSTWLLATGVAGVEGVDGVDGVEGDVGGEPPFEVSPPAPPQAATRRNVIGTRREGRKRMQSSGRWDCFPSYPELRPMVPLSGFRKFS